MNISYRWLRSLAPGITASPQALADRLGLLGAPVDELLEMSAGIEDVVVARVEEVRPHPNADRLRLCTVNAGGEPVQVVCGAPNVEVGGFYPFAPIGARLPGGIEIRKAKLRGEVSEGMLCSARELGLGREHTGLMALAGRDWRAGGGFVEQLELDDARLVLDITPNRPDLLSHIGVARELAPAGAADVTLTPFGAEGEPRLTPVTGERSAAAAGVRVTIEDPVGCRRYMAAVVRGVRIGPSPEWLATRLRVIGVRPINNVVDATNYVLHEMGQPLHAFDLKRLGGSEIRVRRAREGESLRTLDGVDRTLTDGMLVIADAERPVALAGVMGGEESEVGNETTDILLECALFDEVLVRRTARGLGLSSDASYRFERGVDPELQPAALRRVTDLILTIAGGEADDEALDIQPVAFEAPVIEVRPAHVSRLLGIPISAEEIRELLVPIGFEAEGTGEGELRVRVPGYRPDVTREIDVIEEVARRRGYDSFPEELGAFRPGVVPEDALVGTMRRLHVQLAGWGLLEARTAAFAPASETRVPLLNPLSAEESHLRDALVPGLLRRLEHNWAHGVRDVRLYELGSVFFPAEGAQQPTEEVRLAVVLTGGRAPGHWSQQRELWDLWDLKALLSEIAGALGLGSVMPADSPPADTLDGGEAMVLRDRDGELVGWGGRVAAGVLDAPAWAEPVWVLELTLPVDAPRAEQRTYTPLPEYPGSERDLALLVPVGTGADAVERVIRASGGEALETVWPFDLYAGKGIPEGTTSVAWRLRFRRADRTLTDAEVDAGVKSVLAALEGELGVRRR
jgi:phenylalanyl-tRNA synthetase beta chain